MSKKQPVLHTHSENCYKWHHECAIAIVERQRKKIAQRERDLETIRNIMKGKNLL
jgi:hypothetical protein